MTAVTYADRDYHSNCDYHMCRDSSQVRRSLLIAQQAEEELRPDNRTKTALPAYLYYEVQWYLIPSHRY